MSNGGNHIPARRNSVNSKRERNLVNLARSIGPVLEKLEQRQLLSAAAGTLDTTFNLNGQKIVDLGGNDIGSALAVTSNGDIVVGGSTNGNFAVTLIDPTGNVLSTISTQINGSSSAQINGVAIDSSGNIVVVGQVADGATREDIAVARYNIVGHTLQQDLSFMGSATSVDPGSSGYEVTDLNTAIGSHAAPASDSANAVAITPTGDIVVAGETGSGLSEHAFILAYTSTGSIDAGMFGGNHGIVVSSGPADFANAITLTSTGGVIAAGGQVASGNAELFNPNASPLGEVVSLGGGASINAITTYGLSGNYLVAGVANSSFVLAEVNAAGALVSGFGTGGGEIQTSFGSSSAAANALAIQSNGKIVVAGSEVDSVTGNELFALVRYNANGTLDTSFGSGGTVTTDFSSGAADNIATGVAVQSDGQIVVAGSTGAGSIPDNIAVARYIANNAPVAANATASLDNVAENDPTPAGTTVAALASRFGLSDPDGDSVGLAITAANDTFGTWEYSTDAGSNWNPITGVSVNNALLLAPTTSNVIRFVPTIGDTGTSSLTVQGWDQTKGSSNTFANIATNAAANYNSFSDAVFTANVLVSPVSAPVIVYVNDAFTGAPGSNVTDGFGQHTLGVDAFATIQAAVNAVAANGIVEVEAGTYAENVIVNKSVSILGPNIAFDPNSGLTPPNAQAIVEPGSGSNADSGSVFLVEADNVTIAGLTIQGSNSSLSGGFVLPGGVIVYAGAGISNAANVASAVNSDLSSVTDISNLTVQNNIVKDFKWVGIYGDTSDGAASGGNVIADNYVTDIPWDTPAYAGEGILIYDNFYASVTGNVLTAVRTGIQTGNDFLADPSGAGSISNNHVSAFFRGIYDNLQYSNSTGFTVDGNTITFDSADLPAGYDSSLSTPTDQYFNYNVGLLVQSLQSGVTSTIQDNNVSGFKYGVELWNLPTSSTVVLQGGILSGNTYGVYATNNDPRFGAASATQANLNGVTITESTVAGVYVQDGLPIASDAPIGLTLTGNTSISGGGDGIDLSGPDATLAFSGAAPASISTVSGNYIALSGGAELNQSIDASNVSFNGFVGSSEDPGNPSDLAGFYGVEDKITDALDDSTLGLVRLKSGDLFVAHSSETANAGAIQRAINVANSGDSIYVQGGLFQDNLTVNKSVALHGAYAGTSGASASGLSPTRSAANETEILTNGNQDAIIQVTASNVTIDGFYLEGNAAVAGGGTLASGVNSNALYGVLAGTGASSNPDAVSNLTVENDVIKDVFIGMRGDGVNSTTAVTGGLITDNWFDSIGNFDFGYAVSLRTSFYADVTNNLMTRVWTGIHLNDFHLAGGPAAWTISGNNIQSYAAGLLYWLQYGSATPLTFENNQISAATGAVANNFGVLITTVQNSDGINFTNNTISGTGYGIGLTNVSTSDVITLDGTNSISGSTIAGVYLTDNLNFNPVGTTNLTSNSYTGPANAINVDIDGMSISTAPGAVGIEVQASRGSNDVAATATITGDTSITTGGSGTGILVSGSDASADITGNDASIFGNAVGIQVSGGSAAITNNHIYDNTTGIDFTNGGSGSVTDNNFAGSTDNVTDLEIDSSAGAVTIGDGNQFAATDDYIEDLSSQSFDLSSDTSTTFGGANAALLAVNPSNLPTFYAIEDKLVDAIDQTGLGFIRIHADNVFVTPNSFLNPAADDTGAIQRAVDVSSDGDTVNIEAGTYFDNVIVDKSITLDGAGQGLTIIYSATANPNPEGPGSGSLGGGESDIILVQADDVTITQLTVDGNNPNISSGLTSHGVNVDARNGIIENYNAGVFNNLNVNHVTVQNIYLRGLYASSGGTFDFEYDSVTNVAGDPNEAIAIFNYGGSGIMAHDIVSDAEDAISSNWSTGTQFLDNTITNSGSGIHTDNSGEFGSNDVIAGNNISLGTAGSYGIFVFAPYSGVSVHDNIISGVSVGLAEFGSQGPSAPNITFNNNTVDLTSVAGGTGAYVTTSLLGFGFADASATFTNNTIENAATGFDIERDPSDTSSDTASAALDSNNITNNSGDGVYVSGGTGAVAGTSSASITNNNISGNGDGIELTSGATATVSGNDFTGSPNGTDLLVDSTAGAVSVGDGNKFAGTTYIQDLSPQTIDLTVDPNTTFSGNQPSVLNPVTPGDLATLYGIEDRIVDNLDNPADGYVRIKSGYEFVTSLSESTTAGAVQRAVNDSLPNDTVDIAAGNFAGAVSVGQDLALNGAGNGAGGTTIVAPAAITSQFATGSGNKFAVIYAGANDVVIENLIVNGNSSGNSYGDGFVGIGYYNAGGSVAHVTIENVQNSPFNGVQNGVALYADNADSNPRTLDVTNNTILNYQKNGMALSGAGLSVDVEGNAVTGAGATPLIAQNGIQVGFGAGGIINGNTVSGDSYTGASAADSAAILLFESAAGTSVTNNTISGSDIGIDVDDTTGAVAITSNQITGSPGAGILVDEDPGFSSAYDIGHNTISGGVGDGGAADNTGDGIDLFGDISGSNIHNDLISSNTGTGIYVDSSVADSAATLPVNDNSISGNATAGLDNESSITVDASNNWWNSANGPTAASNTDNVGSQGDSITGPGSTVFTPWLTSGHNNAPPAPGFVPDANISFAPISGPATGTEGATYTLALGQSPDITGWTINWGDGPVGNPDTQVVSGDPANVTHVFAEFGTYTISATPSSAQPISSNTVTIAVADAPLNITGGVTLNTTEGQSISNATVATLTDTAGSSSNPTDLSGTIDWGDHSSSNAVLVENGNTGVYSVEGSHTYAEYGDYTIQITINDVGGQNVSTTSSAAVADAALNAVGVAVNATEGQALNNVQVATLTDAAGTFSNPGDLSAIINWGDSSSSAATLVENGNTGVYVVEGSHTYAEFGSYPIHVTYIDSDGNPGGSTTTSNSMASVADAPLSLSLNPLSPVEGVPLTNVVVGTLTDGAGSDSNPSDLTTTIHWGDGQTSLGTLVATGGGVYNVLGTHTYAHSYSNITFSVNVIDAGTASVSQQESINVAFNPPTVDLTGSATSTSVGSTYTLTINGVTDPGPNNVLGYIIDWGDTTLTQAISGGSPANQTFTHTFEIPNASDGVTVTIIDSDGPHNAVLIVNNSPLAGAFDVNVNDVPPTATPENFLPTVTVGSAGLVGLTNPMSVSTYESGLGFTYSFDFNNGPTDGGIFQIQNSSSSSAMVPASFLSSPGQKLVVMRIQDAFGDFTDYSTDITVNDVAPDVNLGTPNPASANQNATFTRTGSFTYPGNDAPYTAEVDYEFGAVGDPGFTPLTLNPNNTFTLSNNYNAAGNYTIKVEVTDAFGTTGSATLGVNVTPSTFQVTSLTPTASGFDVTFNRAANLNVLNLYSSGSGPYGIRMSHWSASMAARWKVP